MIISLEREEDKKALADLLDILETSTRFYKERPSEALWKAITEVHQSYESLKSKVEGDYTEADSRRRRVDALLNDKVR